ncbi:MAG: hypothetical protein RJB11_477 [Planctomycetota bacterium]
MPLVHFALVLVLSETVLVLEGACLVVVDIRAKYWGSRFLEKVIALNRFSVIEHEYEFEKARLLPTKTREKPSYLKLCRIQNNVFDLLTIPSVSDMDKSIA